MADISAFHFDKDVLPPFHRVTLVGSEMHSSGRTFTAEMLCFKDLFLFLTMNVSLSRYMHKGAGACRGQQRAADHLDSGLQPDVSFRERQKPAEGVRPRRTGVKARCELPDSPNNCIATLVTLNIPLQKEKHLFLMVANTNCPPNFVKKAEPHTNISSEWTIASEASFKGFTCCCHPIKTQD